MEPFTLSKQDQLEQYIHQQVTLYETLLTCLKEERICLKKADVDGLWKISETKQSTIMNIDFLHHEIIAFIKQFTGKAPKPPIKLENYITLVSKNKRSDFKKTYHALISLAEQIYTCGEDNKKFVEDCLLFIDEIIDVMVRSSSRHTMYDKEMKLKDYYFNMIIHKEV